MLECCVNTAKICDGEQSAWLTEIGGFDVQDVSFYLQLLKKTISRYIHEFRMLGNVDTRLLSVGHIYLHINAPAREPTSRELQILLSAELKQLDNL